MNYSKHPRFLASIVYYHFSTIFFANIAEKQQRWSFISSINYLHHRGLQNRSSFVIIIVIFFDRLAQTKISEGQHLPSLSKVLKIFKKSLEVILVFPWKEVTKGFAPQSDAMFLVLAKLNEL